MLTLALAGASGCGSSAAEAQLSESERSQLLARIDEARAGARSSDRRRAMRALGSLRQEVDRLAREGALDDSRARRLLAGVRRARRLAVVELDRPRGRAGKRPGKRSKRTHAEEQEEEGE